MGKRRGRPKKNLPLRDKGTPELIIKRMQLVQGGDPSLSTTPIDICYARKIISAEQYNAGLVFLYLHRSIFGKPFPIHARFHASPARVCLLHTSSPVSIL